LVVDEKSSGFQAEPLARHYYADLSEYRAGMDFSDASARRSGFCIGSDSIYLDIQHSI
jgi:hypothetical protein